MSTLYGSLTGQAKSTATRRGSAKSGISCHIRGWSVGIKVYGGVNDKGEVSFDVYKSTGSNSSGQDIKIGTYTEDK